MARKQLYSFMFEDLEIRVSTGYHCYRWDVIHVRTKIPTSHGFMESPALALSEAFDWIHENADGMEMVG